jgi:hypothetical protein
MMMMMMMMYLKGKLFNLGCRDVFTKWSVEGSSNNKFNRAYLHIDIDHDRIFSIYID